MANIILVGGGGHCTSVIDVIESEKKYSIVGIVDVPEKVGQRLLNYPVIGNDDDLEDLIQKYSMAHITLGHISSPQLRIKLFTHLKQLKAKMPAIISSTAHVSLHSMIGEGSIVMHQALVNVSAIVGNNCIINNKALIEHDAEIGDHCHISTGALVNGECKIGAGCFIGSGAVIRHGISIAPNTIVGAGAVIHKDIIKSGTWVSNTARQIF